MSILETIKKPYKIFTDVGAIEYGAIEQFVEAMSHPAVVRGALMPDVHQGYTVPIGCVFESNGVVFPSAVGYDIGCGMIAHQTNFSLHDIKYNAGAIHRQILLDIPVGRNHRSVSPLPAIHVHGTLDKCTRQMKKIADDKVWAFQLGTLGGGNHFIEIGYDEQDRVWIIIHSGSRGVGHGCAEYYMKKASPTGKLSEGMFGFDVNSQDGRDYIQDMNWCLEFALWNRRVMLYDIIDSIRKCGVEGGIVGDMINRNHNHAETKDGVIWTHRKGATHAEKGMTGVVPGNMRDGCFIVQGKGNEDSLYSSSHGAGRVLSRKKAKDTLSEEDFTSTMRGIVANVGKSTLDESPFAYKDIFEVMRQQSDLVEVIAYTKPILNIKG